MQLYNRTAYNSEGLAAFLKAIVHHSGKGEGWLPNSVVVSYFTPTPKEKLVPEHLRRIGKNGKTRGKRPSPFQFVNYRSTQGDAIHIGLVRPGKLYSSPLEQLAVVSEEVMIAPVQLLAELASAFASQRLYLRSWSTPEVLENEPVDIKRVEWEWVKSFRLSYDLRKKPDKQKLERELFLLRSQDSVLRTKYYDMRNAIRRHEELIEKEEKEVLKIEEQRALLEERIAVLERKESHAGLLPK